MEGNTARTPLDAFPRLPMIELLLGDFKNYRAMPGEPDVFSQLQVLWAQAPSVGATLAWRASLPMLERLPPSLTLERLKGMPVDRRLVEYKKAALEEAADLDHRVHALPHDLPGYIASIESEREAVLLLRELRAIRDREFFLDTAIRESIREAHHQAIVRLGEIRAQSRYLMGPIDDGPDYFKDPHLGWAISVEHKRIGDAGGSTRALESLSDDLFRQGEFYPIHKEMPPLATEQRALIVDLKPFLPAMDERTSFFWEPQGRFQALFLESGDIQGTMLRLFLHPSLPLEPFIFSDSRMDSPFHFALRFIHEAVHHMHRKYEGFALEPLEPILGRLNGAAFYNILVEGMTQSIAFRVMADWLVEPTASVWKGRARGFLKDVDWNPSAGTDRHRVDLLLPLRLQSQSYTNYARIVRILEKRLGPGGLFILEEAVVGGHFDPALWSIIEAAAPRIQVLLDAFLYVTRKLPLRLARYAVLPISEIFARDEFSLQEAEVRSEAVKAVFDAAYEIYLGYQSPSEARIFADLVRAQDWDDEINSFSAGPAEARILIKRKLDSLAAKVR